jgi:hypothetical protein
MSRDIDQVIVNDLRRFDFLAQHIWPKIRLLFKGSVAARCKQCVLSSKAPATVLNKWGICNFCEEFNTLKKDQGQKRWEDMYVAHQRQHLDQMLTDHQGKGRNRYDALVLFSGGKDSVYILSRVRKDYPRLRLLLMTWDNGYYSKVALEASKRIARKLDLDHLVYRPISSVYKTLYRYTLQHVAEKGSYQTVDRLDGTLNQLLGLDFAYEFEIPLVLSGVDWAQSLIMQSQTYFVAPDEDINSRILVDRMEQRSGFEIKNIFTAENQKLFWDGTGKERRRIPKYVLPLAAWRPNKTDVQVQLDKEGLLLKRDSSPIITNNQVLSVMTALDIKRIGYCSFEPEFSAMIRMNESDPIYWKNVFECVEYLIRTDSSILKAVINRVLIKLELTPQDVGL